MQLSWRGVNYLLLGTTFVSFSAEGHLVAFTPLQLRDLGLSPAEVGVWTGLLYAVTTGTALLLGPFWGVLAERFSRRAIILRSQVLLGLAMLVASWAPDLTGLVAARGLMGLSFGTGGVILATQAMLTPNRNLGWAIAIVQAAQPIAGSIGPPLGAFAIPHIGVRGLFLVDAGLMLVAALVLAMLLPEPRGGHKPTSVLRRVVEVFGLIWAAPAIRWSFVNQTLSRGSSAVVDTYLPVRIAQIATDPASATGWILGAYGAMTTLVAWLLSRFAGRFDALRVYWLSMLLGAGLAAGLALAPWLWLLGLLAVLRAIPTACSRPLLLAYLARVVPPQHQTGVFGLLPTAGNVGSLTLPLMAAGLAGLGVGAAMTVSAIGHAVSAGAATRLRRTLKH